MAKQYKTFRTAVKTAKENNLILKDKENLFDFSLLDSIEISAREKEYIKNHDIKYVSATFKESFYGTEFDNFSACIGKSLYHVQNVFSETTKKIRYRIFTLARIEHNTQERNTVWDQYTVTTFNASNEYIEPIFDIEIA